MRQPLGIVGLRRRGRARALGLDLELDLDDVTKCIDDVGLGFLFAPEEPPVHALRRAGAESLGVRTAFNLLGPLTNAAGAQRVVIGSSTRSSWIYLLVLWNALGWWSTPS